MYILPHNIFLLKYSNVRLYIFTYTESQYYFLSTDFFKRLHVKRFPLRFPIQFPYHIIFLRHHIEIFKHTFPYTDRPIFGQPPARKNKASPNKSRQRNSKRICFINWVISYRCTEHNGCPTE